MEKYLIDCRDWECYARGNINKCLKCKKGKVSVRCPGCCKEHIITSTVMRIDCECEVSFIPCYDLCEFINEEHSPKN